MDRNQLTGFLLIGLLFITFFYFISPEPPKEQDRSQKRDTPEEQIRKTPDTAKSKPVADTLSPGNSDTSQIPGNKKTRKQAKPETNLPEPFAAKTQGKDKPAVIENEVLKLKLSRKGGNIRYAELKEYKKYSQEPLVLIDSNSNRLDYQFLYKNRSIHTSDLYFKPSKESVKVTGDDSATITMRMQLNEDQYLE